MGNFISRSGQGLPPSFVDGVMDPEAILEKYAGLDFSELKEKDKVYRNYEAKDEPRKGKVIALSQTGRHATGFVTVEWEDGETTLELPNWLRKDPTDAKYHTDPELFRTNASLLRKAFDNEKVVFANEFGLEIKQSSLDGIYRFYLDGEMTKTAKSPDEVKEIMEQMDVMHLPHVEEETQSTEGMQTPEESAADEVFDSFVSGHETSFTAAVARASQRLGVQLDEQVVEQLVQEKFAKASSSS